MRIKRRSFLKGFVASCFFGAKVGRATIEKDIVKVESKPAKKKKVAYSAKCYQVGEPITVVHRAPTGSNVEAEIYLPGGYRDSGYPDLCFTDTNSNGIYTGEYTLHFHQWRGR